MSDLLDYYESRNMTGFSDTLTELANRDNEIRWALTPSVLQHVGQKSTKGDILNGARILMLASRSRCGILHLRQMMQIDFETSIFVLCRMSSLLDEPTMVAPSANFDSPELFITPHLESMQSLPTRANKPILHSSLWQRAKE